MSGTIGKIFRDNTKTHQKIINQSDEHTYKNKYLSFRGIGAYYFKNCTY
jgi:hypothetical protein